MISNRVDMETDVFYYGDNLRMLRHCSLSGDHDYFLDDSVDLIYLDPPFFTGKVQKGTWQPEAMEISFEDSKQFWADKAEVMWDKAPMWLRHVALKRPDFASYLYYMMVRLEACKRVLKPTGSIWLHCDYRASHYLRMVMDEVFGHDQFVNEVVWYYKTGGTSKRWLGRKHDTIFFYAKTDKYKFFPQQEKSYLTHKYGFSNVEIHQDEGGYYTMVGMRDVWDVPALRGNQPETTGYPTQKPQALLERVIRLASQEGDVVLDPFCGCGTALVAAHKLNRHWIGIDITHLAVGVTKKRFQDHFPGIQFKVIGELED